MPMTKIEEAGCLLKNELQNMQNSYTQGGAAQGSECALVEASVVQGSEAKYFLHLTIAHANFFSGQT